MDLHDPTTHALPGGHTLTTGRLPAALTSAMPFEPLWNLHPDSSPVIHLHGRRVAIPRWQQAFGRDYRFSGQVSRAEPIPAALLPLLAWARSSVDAALDGLLLNWYDGALGHYIGRHRDSEHGLAADAPIVTISFGEPRVFRLRPHRHAGRPLDFATGDGTVFVMPLATNRAFTHEIVRSARARGRRISVTIRAFATAP